MPRVKKKIDENNEIKGDRKKIIPIKIVKGMKDILPPERFIWDYILEKSGKLCGEFGFGKIETPILEHSVLYERGVGKSTDIVEKEMFSFETQGGGKVSLRPEGTAGVARAYIENGMNKWVQPVKLYYTGPMFRYENPQLGRQREHHQFGFEVFGGGCSAIDAQVIYLAWKIFQKIGISNTTIQINSIGCSDCRPNYKNLLNDYYEMKINKLCADCKERLVKNPLRLLDCKEEKCIRTASSAPQIIDHLCTDCHDHFKNILEFLDELELPYVLNPSLVRGLDYYTKTVFEIWTDEQDARQSALGGGGRYDALIKELGGDSTPAIGFSFGIERAIKQLVMTGFSLDQKTKKQIFLVQLGDLARKKILKLFDSFIDKNISVGESIGRGSIKSQLKMANRFGAKLAIIIGQKEAIDGTVIVRDMESGTQEIIIMERIVDEVKRRLKN